MSEMRKRTNVPSIGMEDDSDIEGDHADDGVDFQKYAEDMLMKRLLEKEKEEQKKMRETNPRQQGNSGISDRQLLYIIVILGLALLSMLGIIAFLVLKKRI